MLLELTIRNIALIESLCIEFARGFNVLTGETGTGKSIIIDSINLVLGGRADRDMIRTGAERGMVQALFDISGNAAAMDVVREMGADFDAGTVVIRRELSREGRNICRIGDVIVPLNALKRLTSVLMDIHGQHEHQALLNPSRHVGFLDAYAGKTLEIKLAEVGRLYAQRKEISAELKKLMTDDSDRARLLDILTFQVQEINAAKLKRGEEQMLAARLSVLENAEKIRQGIEDAYTMVYQGSGPVISAQEALLRAADAMEEIAPLNDRYGSISAKLRELYYGVQDIGYDIQSLREELDFEPEELEKTAARLDVIHRLERKYGESLEDVLQFCKEASARLDGLRHGDESIAELKKQYRQADSRLRTACGELTEIRRKNAVTLGEAVCTQLKDLGMGKTRFEVRVEPLDKPSRDGMDRVEFMISPNPGEPLRPLSSIASGGEISRIMLALKCVAVDMEGVDAMIFDEIDTGVSGRTAQAVGEKMCLLAKRRQVLSVTHLPQIAALGDVQFVVEKSSDDVRTDTRMHRLSKEERIHEIARLIGGAQETESSLAHAANMLKEAELRKETIC